MTVLDRLRKTLLSWSVSPTESMTARPDFRTGCGGWSGETANTSPRRDDGFNEHSSMRSVTGSLSCGGSIERR